MNSQGYGSGLKVQGLSAGVSGLKFRGIGFMVPGVMVCGMSWSSNRVYYLSWSSHSVILHLHIVVVFGDVDVWPAFAMLIVL